MRSKRILTSALTKHPDPAKRERGAPWLPMYFHCVEILLVCFLCHPERGGRAGLQARVSGTSSLGFSPGAELTAYRLLLIADFSTPQTPPHPSPSPSRGNAARAARETRVGVHWVSAGAA